jgi:hypothetical protein
MATPEAKKLAVPDQEQLIARLQAEVHHPDEIDAATERLGISPSLINPYLATAVDVSFLGLGDGVNLPVQISRRQGGRSSLYFLHPGEKVLVSLVATSGGVVFRYVSRDTGSSMPARGGDEYSEEFRDLTGKVLLARRGELEVLDAERGIGRFLTRGEGEGEGRGWWISVFWSFISVGSGDLVL